LGKGKHEKEPKKYWIKPINSVHGKGAAKKKYPGTSGELGKKI